jgi:hypothetical protein
MFAALLAWWGARSTLELVTGFVTSGLVLPVIRIKKVMNLIDEIETGKQRDAEQRDRENALQNEIALKKLQSSALERTLGRILQEKQAAEKKFADLEEKFRSRTRACKGKGSRTNRKRKFLAE